MKIEKNIPIPAKIMGIGGARKYPFPDMDVGDSIEFDITEAKKVRSAASLYGQRNGVKFITRKRGDKLRLWRVK